MKISISYNNKLISNQIILADSFYHRLLGLMFKGKIEDGDGLLISPCNSIHTFFMKYPLDIVFIGHKNQVVKIIRNLKPWKMTWIYFKAIKTLELPAGKLPLDLKEGDFLEVKNV